jgi:hypothetical protein
LKGTSKTSSLVITEELTRVMRPSDVSPHLDSFRSLNRASELEAANNLMPSIDRGFSLKSRRVRPLTPSCFKGKLVILQFSKVRFFIFSQFMLID